MADIIQTNKNAPHGYHSTNAGILPNEWVSRPLGSIVEEITETVGTRKIETVSISAGVGFVNQVEKFGKELSGKQYEKYTVLHQGDFSYNKGNSNLYPQGCIYRLNDRTEAAVPNVFESFRVSDGNPDFYEQLFVSGFLNRQLYSRINRGVRDDGLLNLRGKDFYSCEVPCPPLSEQERIAEILMQCDKVIELKQRKIKELGQLKKACLRMMFPEKGHNKPIIRFPGFSEAWEQRKLGEVVGVYDGVHQTPKYQNEGIMFLSVENIATMTSTKYISEEAFERDYKVYPEKGDILMTRIGDVGTPNVVNTTEKIAFYVSLALIKPQGIDSYFLCNAIQSPFVKCGIRNRTLLSAIPQKINKDEIGKIDFMFPSNIEEQSKIGAYFSNLENLITLHQRELEEQKINKKALAQLLLTGVTRVSV